MKTITLLISVLFSSCFLNTKKEDMNGFDVRLFKGTPVWEVAKAVEDDNVDKIKLLLKNKPDSIINFQEEILGMSLLNWVVFNNRYQSVKALLELESNPNLQSKDGTSAFIQACSKYETSEYAKLLLKYGGKPNDIAKAERPQILRTPLQAAAVRFETFKLLIESGADPSYIHPYYEHRSALEAASLSDNLDVITYLIYNVGVDYKRAFGTTQNGDRINILTYLRTLTYPLDSEDYKKKMKLVAFLKKNGMDYWEESIPMQFYQNYDSVYLSKY